MPKLRQTTFETQIFERYRRRQCSVEEALVEMYLAGVYDQGLPRRVDHPVLDGVALSAEVAGVVGVSAEIAAFTSSSSAASVTT